MDSKRKTAIIVRILIGAFALTLMLSLLTGSMRVSILMDAPVNILTVLLACLAASVAMAVGILFYLEKSSSCKNRSCRYHPQYTDDDDSLFKEMTGVLDVSDLKKAGLIDDDVCVAESSATYTQRSPKTTSSAAREEAQAKPVNSSAQINQVKTQEAVVVPNASELVPDITHEEIFGASLETFACDEGEPIEEPCDKPSMDFTDTMIPIIITAVYNTRLEAARAANKSVGNKALNEKSAAIAWLFNEQPRVGKHFKSTAVPTRHSKKASVTHIESVA